MLFSKEEAEAQRDEPSDLRPLGHHSLKQRFKPIFSDFKSPAFFFIPVVITSSPMNSPIHPETINTKYSSMSYSKLLEAWDPCMLLPEPWPLPCTVEILYIHAWNAESIQTFIIKINKKAFSNTSPAFFRLDG